MGFNGSGTFTVINTFVYDTVISETEVNANFSDIATGLSTCITSDGQTTPTANIPFGGFKLTGVGAGSAATDAATIGGTETLTSKTLTAPTINGIVGGTATSQTITALTTTTINGVAAATAQYTTAEETKLSGIEALADVTDATNVAAAGAAMVGAASNTFTGYMGVNGATAESNMGIATRRGILVTNSVLGAPTTSGVGLDFDGTNGRYFVKTNASHKFYSDVLSTLQFQITHTATAVNILGVTGGAAGSPPVLSATGSDTNVDLRIYPKAAGVLDIYGTAATAASVPANFSAAEYLAIKVNGVTKYLPLATATW